MDKWQCATVDNSDQNIGIKSLKMKVFFMKSFWIFCRRYQKVPKKNERNNQIWIEKDAKNEIPGFSSNLKAEKVKSKNLRQIGPV